MIRSFLGFEHRSFQAPQHLHISIFDFRRRLLIRLMRLAFFAENYSLCLWFEDAILLQCKKRQATVKICPSALVARLPMPKVKVHLSLFLAFSMNNCVMKCRAKDGFQHVTFCNQTTTESSSTQSKEKIACRADELRVIDCANDHNNLCPRDISYLLSGRENFKHRGLSTLL